MGWGRTFFLGDLGNRLNIADTERDIERLRREIAATTRRDLSQDERIDLLMRENAELKLYLASIIRLLLTRGTITRAELEAMVDAVDREDGQADGGFDGKII